MKQLLALDTGRDMGVDGVVETLTGEYDAYQVKFRSDRPSLTWRELSTFMGLTEKVNQRVLFTNCDNLPSVMNERAGFFCIRGSDLDRLEPRDFSTIRKWLKTGQVKLEPRTPDPHQREALKSIRKGLKDNDRAAVIMACGTGKTLVSLWAAERWSTDIPERPSNLLFLAMSSHLRASPIPGRRARPPEQRKIRTPEPQRGLRGIPNVVLDVVCTRHERD